jgi:murein L,D-transpeptidase YafK
MGCAKPSNLEDLAAEARTARHIAWDARREANRALVWAEAAEQRAAEALQRATPPSLRAARLRSEPLGKADRVVVRKAERTLELYRAGKLLRSFPIALGFEPIGHKKRQGDGRTPEGVYQLDIRRQTTRFGPGLHISYPKPEDRRRARALGVPAGGAIYIHGLPDGLGVIGADHAKFDWTDGCIAVTNEELDEIWARVEDGTEIEILP